MRLLVGLGNPGEEYEQTRHNLGFVVLDEVAKRLEADDWEAFKGGEVAEARLNGEKHLLFKPMQYMNRSGEPLRALIDYYGIEVGDVCIVSDDVYVRPGSARVRQGGGDGGHNGWRSVMEHVKPDDFWRVRIGAGLYEQNPVTRRHLPPLDTYVLQPLPAHDRKQAEDLIDTLVPNLVGWLENGQISEETVHI